MHHRLGQEAAGIRRAQADRGLARRGNRSREPLVQKPAQNHHGNVACIAIGNAQPIDKAALDAHAFERRRKNLPAAVHDQYFVALMRELRHLPRQRFHRRRVVQQCSGYLDDHSHRSPVASPMPSIAFMFCTAWPAAPCQDYRDN